MRKTKKLAVECILLAMEEIKGDLTLTTDKDEVEAYGKAMLNLAEAFRIVINS